jgi:hypothetical protein
MAFSDRVVLEAWKRANGRCECERTTHAHLGRCFRQLSWNSRGKDTNDGWEAHHVTAGGPDTLSNCEILCQDCHKKTGTYG